MMAPAKVLLLDPRPLKTSKPMFQKDSPSCNCSIIPEKLGCSPGIQIKLAEPRNQIAYYIHIMLTIFLPIYPCYGNHIISDISISW